MNLLKTIVWCALAFCLFHDTAAIFFGHGTPQNSNEKPPSVDSDQVKQMFELKANYAETGIF